jgi:hypothetical protein
MHLDDLANLNAPGDLESLPAREDARPPGFAAMMQSGLSPWRDNNKI